MVWFEVVAITVLALYVAARPASGNPLTADDFFPWIWLAPTLLALRYGSMAGVGSAGIVLLGWMVSYFSKAVTTTFPTEYFLGGLILTLGAGQFSDIWRGRLKRVREINGYLDQRLEALTRRHHVLKLSHDRLEHDLLARPLTLRNSLSDLRRHVLREDVASSAPLRQAQELMRILVQTSRLEKASLHAEINGRLDVRPVASVGGVAGLNVKDPLVELALAHNELCHVQTATLRYAKSRYLVAAPVIDAAGNRLGLLVVERMPFLCLNKEALQIMKVTLGYYADIINVDQRTFDLCRDIPGCPSQFAEEMFRLERIYQQCSVPSAIVAMKFNVDEKKMSMVFAESDRKCRRLDVRWQIRSAGHGTLITVLPLHGEVAAEGYVTRMEDRMTRLLGWSEPDRSCIRSFVSTIEGGPAGSVLSDILEKCHA